MYFWTTLECWRFKLFYFFVFLYRDSTSNNFFRVIHAFLIMNVIETVFLYPSSNELINFIFLHFVAAFQSKFWTSDFIDYISLHIRCCFCVHLWWSLYVEHW